MSCSGIVTHYSHFSKKKPDGLSPNDTLQMKKVLRFKYIISNVWGVGEEEERLDNTLKENNIKISVITESKRRWTVWNKVQDTIGQIMKQKQRL
jgi:(p)ppGpp synthase/HD superfamily hydrolase